MRWMFVKQGATTPWSPSDLTSLAAWYDADDASTIFDATSGGSLPSTGGAVARWEDKSGNGRHLTAAANQPTYDLNALNGKPNIGFTTSQYLSLSSAFMYDAGACTVATMPSGLGDNGNNFVIVEGSSTSNTPIYSPICRQSTVDATAHAAYVRTDGNIKPVDYVPHAPGGSYPIIVVEDTGTAMNYTANGGALTSFVGSYTRGTTTLNRFAVGALLRSSASLQWNGSIPEIVICDAVLSNADRQKLEGYLAHKWGLTASLDASHPYKTSAP